MKKNRLSILSIGNEVVDGQIINSNAKWLSEKFNSLGYEVHSQISIKDNLSDIHSAIEYSASYSGVLVLTGGLGPTSDDLTCDAVSKYVNKTLVKNQASYDKMKILLNSRGVLEKPGHLSQCLFPKDSKIFANNAGTADAFVASCNEIKIICLPGPPSEISAILNDGLNEWLVDNLDTSRPKDELLIWTFFLLPESDLSSYVEKKIKPIEDSKLTQNKFEIGYRASFPYLELKLWCQKGFLDQYSQVFNEICDNFKSSFLWNDDAYCMGKILSKSEKYSFAFIDTFSKGYLSNIFYKENNFEKNKFLYIESFFNAKSLFKNISTDITSLFYVEDGIGKISIRLKETLFKSNVIFSEGPLSGFILENDECADNSKTLVLSKSIKKPNRKLNYKKMNIYIVEALLLELNKIFGYLN